MTKAAVARRWALRRWDDGTKRSKPKAVSVSLTSLVFPGNTQAGSDIRLKFKGANLPSRTGFTASWASRSNASITGYCTHCFWSYDIAAWQGSFYELGGHPFPANSSAEDGTGQATNGAGGSGTTHYMEMAGLGARDQISNPGTAVLATKDGTSWKRHALQCVLINSNTQLRHRYWPDVVADPTNYFEYIIATSSLESPSDPAFYWGSSDWRNGLGGGGAGTNDETVNGALSKFSIVATGNVSTTQVGGIAGCNTDDELLAFLSSQSLTPHYVCMSPTPTDVTDKSGAGHNPSFDSARLPTLGTG